MPTFNGETMSDVCGPVELADAGTRTDVIARAFGATGLLVPQAPELNPPLWELGHIGWFAEYWVLRRAGGRAPLRADADALYDSAKVAHATRWSLPLPAFDETLRYVAEIRARACDALVDARDEATRYFGSLATYHEDMHGEAALMSLQTLRRPWPFPDALEPDDAGPLPGDVEVPAGRYRIGAERDAPFVFDNEKWAHDVDLAAFRIARAPVTNVEYASFVEAGGPVPRDWVRGDDGAWRRARFDAFVPLRPHAPVCNVDRFAAEAFCRWAGRRLPTEAEWEVAATYDPRTGAKRRYPWGNAPPDPTRAHLDARAREPLDVAALPAGDSPLGVRQLIGNVWEWTASAFTGYPGFACDPYAEYSEPWFGSHAVLRGGAWTTRARLVDGLWRNFYLPHRSDAFAGFRTVALRATL
jgi:iron(II)-dependent oxidoreductase